MSLHPDLTVVQGDVRNPDQIDLTGVDAIIHLSSVANDPCGDLDPKLTWEISCLATMQLADRAKRHGIKRFIYASSGSVYGVKDEEQVTEDLELLPISEYNKTKMCGERIVLSYKDDMVVQIVRPATVCGFSPRQRLDVSVNMLTMQALMNGRITVFGGDQTRPNIHIDDITDLYLFLLDHPEHTGVYNAGFENISILDIAQYGRQARPGGHRGDALQRPAHPTASIPTGCSQQAFDRKRLSRMPSRKSSACTRRVSSRTKTVGTTSSGWKGMW